VIQQRRARRGDERIERAHRPMMNRMIAGFGPHAGWREAFRHAQRRLQTFGFQERDVDAGIDDRQEDAFAVQALRFERGCRHELCDLRSVANRR
jgi:hypothetical protein